MRARRRARPRPGAEARPWCHSNPSRFAPKPNRKAEGPPQQGGKGGQNQNHQQQQQQQGKKARTEGKQQNGQGQPQGQQQQQKQQGQQQGQQQQGSTIQLSRVLVDTGANAAALLCPSQD